MRERRGEKKRGGGERKKESKPFGNRETFLTDFNKAIWKLIINRRDANVGLFFEIAL